MVFVVTIFLFSFPVFLNVNNKGESTQGHGNYLQILEWLVLKSRLALYGLRLALYNLELDLRPTAQDQMQTDTIHYKIELFEHVKLPQERIDH